MANNQYANLVKYGSNTLIDLTGDTVTAATLAQGYTAHDASGAPITGSMTSGTMIIRDETDSHGGTIRYITAGDVVTGTVQITQNGTVDVAQYADADVNVPPTYTATVSGTGNVSYCFAKKNNSGIPYNTDGDTFTFGDGDDIYVRCKGLSSGCTISINGTTVLSGTGTNVIYYTMPDPRCDVTIEMTYGNTSSINLSIPSASIGTINVDGSIQSVGAYAYVNVNGLSIDSLRKFISNSRNTSAFNNLDYWPSSISSIGAYAFAECTYFNPSSIPNTITVIEKYAFYDCMRFALTSLPSGVTSIGSYAFYNCQALALTSLPSGVTSIQLYSFYNCTSLALTSLPSGVTSIGNYAFYCCYPMSLTSLPSGVKTIGNYAFASCTHLSLTSLPSGLTTLGNNAFQYCSSLAITSVPDGITVINSSTFYRCTSLTTMSLPSGTTSIQSSAFGCCSGLMSISCSGPITTLSNTSFQGGTDYEMQLASVSFPNMEVSSLTTAFGNSTTANAACHYLAFADIGSTKSIASSAFANCYALQTLVLRRSDAICSLSSTNAFTNTPMSGYNSLTGTVYVPNALISTYQSASNWSTLYNNGTVTFMAIEGSAYDLS